MDTVSIATTIMTSRAQAQAGTVAMKLTRQNLDAQKQIADMLTASTEGLAKAATGASHLGTNLDVTV